MTSGIGETYHQPTSEQGFTLLELLIVAALMVVMAGMAMPNLKRLVAQVQFQNGVEHLRAVLDGLHDRALWEHRMFHLVIDPEKNEYRAFAHEREQKPSVCLVPRSIRLESDRKEIIFYPDGSIDPARISFADDQEGVATFVTQGVFGGIKLQMQ